MVDHVLASLQHHLTAAVVVGLLTFGAPTIRHASLRSPPAVVRVQVGPTAGATAWREFIGPPRSEPN